MMPLRAAPYEFPALPREAFKGLPGLLADSLPDTYGNALIDAWLARQGRTPESFDPVERLCYTGVRGMGALEFKPALFGRAQSEQASLRSRHWWTSPTKFSTSAALLPATCPAPTMRRPSRTSSGSVHRPAVRVQKPSSRGTSRAASFAPGRSRMTNGLQLLADEVRRHREQSRQGTCRPAGLRDFGVRLLPDGDGRRHRHVRVPPASRGRPRTFHDPALRSQPSAATSCTCRRSAP